MAEETQDENTEAEVLEPPPRDYAVRAVFPGAQLRDGEDEARPIMFGYLARFNEWAKVDSRIEGRFYERMAPGAFKNTINQNRSRMRVIYDHGNDPRFGRHPLGPIDRLEEDDEGVVYEVPLLDTSYNRDLLPGLRAGVYGASYRFRTVKMDPPVRPRRETEYNPDRWEERTIREVEMPEFGPTPFPVYAGSTAGVRSLTDEFRINQLGIDPEQLRALLTSIALPSDRAGEDHSAEASRVHVPSVTTNRFKRREDFLTWLSRN